ncbi:MAG TPA: hypothetical protein VE398_05120, partial [Acidobacteriota bacterium]|nr:hypothetical protein [Acidobacteriota bacterium]
MRIRELLFLLGVAILLMPAASGCGSQGTTSDPSAPAAINPSGRPVDSSTAGSLSGIVRLQGNPPNRRAISMAAVPNCSKEHASPALTEEAVP